MMPRLPSLAAALALAAVAVASGASTASQRPGETAARTAAIAAVPRGRSHARPTVRKRTAVARATQTPDPLSSTAWGLRAIGAPALWKLGEGSPTVVVAVLDTGVDPKQPDLRGALLPGWNALDGSSETGDEFGHGTAVAGVVAARAHNGIGASGYCPRCSILPVKVLDATGHGFGDRIAAGVDWAAGHGADVINLSLSVSSHDDAIAAAIARASARGILVVAAAGNNGSTSPTYPSSEPNVISVAAVDPARQLYPWSARGGWVDLEAPGCNQSGNLAQRFDDFCGTSSAAAAASGVLALALSDGATPAAIRKALPARSSDDAVHAVDLPRLLSAVLPATLRAST